MKYYGINQSEMRDSFTFYALKCKALLRRFFTCDKDKKERQTHIIKNWFENNDEIDSESNAIPEGRYCSPFSIKAYDIVAKERVEELKKGIKKLVQTNMSHQFLGITVDEDLFKHIDRVNAFFDSSNTWIRLGPFDLGEAKREYYGIDFFEMEIRNFCGSHYAIEFTMMLTKKCQRSLAQFIARDFSGDSWILYRHFSRTRSKTGAVQRTIVAHIPRTSAKAASVEKKVTEIKWRLLEYVSTMIPLKIHLKDVAPPSIVFYKTNLGHDEKDGSFWASLGIDAMNGEFVDDGRKLFFHDAHRKKYQANNLSYVIHDAKCPHGKMYATWELQETHGFSGISRSLGKLLLLDVVNQIFLQQITRYRNQISKVKIKKRTHRTVLKLRYSYEREISVFDKILSEVEWEKESEKATDIFIAFPNVRVNSKFRNYRAYMNIIDSCVFEAKKNVKSSKEVKEMIQEKLTITEYLTNYRSERNSFLMNLLMLLIAVATFVFVVFPLWAEDFGKWIIEILK